MKLRCMDCLWVPHTPNSRVGGFVKIRRTPYIGNKIQE
jgi:hypothetical protein